MRRGAMLTKVVMLVSPQCDPPDASGRLRVGADDYNSLCGVHAMAWIEAEQMLIVGGYARTHAVAHARLSHARVHGHTPESARAYAFTHAQAHTHARACARAQVLRPGWRRSHRQHSGVVRFITQVARPQRQPGARAASQGARCIA
jgi:hypothetical protein